MQLCMGIWVVRGAGEGGCQDGTGGGCLVWHIFLWQSAPMVGALATEEDEVLALICFCCESWDCFPCWEEGICAVQCSLLPKIFVVRKLLFPT